MAIISKIKLPNGNQYDLADAFAREQISTIKQTVAGGVQYVGSTTTELSDGATGAEVVISKGDTTQNHTAAVGDMVDHNNVLYIFNKNGQWDQLGSAGPIKALAYKDSVTGTVIPSGKISAQVFTGSEMTSTGSVTATGKISQPVFTGAQGDVSVTGTPTGTVAAPKFTGTEGDISVTGTPKGSVALTSSAVGEGQTATYIPSGTVEITPTTGKVKEVTSVGTLPNFTTTVTDETLVLGWDAGTLPTSDDATVATGVQTAVFTGTGIMLNGTFTGQTTTSTGKFTPEGTNDAPAFTGKDLTSTGKYTASGTVSALSFTGDAVDVSVSGTPSGTISQAEFTGTEATVTSK